MKLAASLCACHGTCAPLLPSLPRSLTRSNSSGSGSPPVRIISASDWDKIVLARKLDAITREIDHRDGIRSGRLRLLHEVAQGPAQRISVEVARAGHVKARCLKRLRDQAGVIGRGGERRLGVGAIA